MKTHYTILIVILNLFLLATLKAQNVNIPDSNFKSYLLEISTLNSNMDDEISVAEAEAFSNSLDVSGREISNLTGIEAFINLVGLDCSFNDLSSLDISANTMLEELNIRDNEIAILDLSSNTSLRELNIGQNLISTLDVSGLALLEEFLCDNNNLTQIDVTSNLALWNLHFYNNSLTSIDLSQNSALLVIEAGGMEDLTSIDVSNNTLLTILNLDASGVTSIDVANNTALKTLVVSRTNITSVDISQNTDLERFYAGELGLTSIDISANSKLEELALDANELSALDLSNHVELELISICCNELSGDLDLSNHSKLTRLNIVRNDFNSLNIKNGNSNNISDFNAEENPNLTCIVVDEVSIFEPKWNENVDNVAFTNDPCVSISSISLSTQGGITTLAGENETLQIDHSISPSNATFQEIQWSTEDSSIATVDENGLVSPVASGSTKINAIAKDGSGVSSAIDITVSLVTSIKKSVNLTIFPNPSSSMIFLDIVGISELKTTIYNLSGNVVYKGVHNKNNDRINLKHLLPGTYVIECQMEEKTIRNTLIIDTE
ncbi:Ig-like domain-containing protein [Ekhidna sp.]